MAEAKDIHVDILAMELKQKLPYWLSPHQRDPARTEAIRKKHRDKWLAERRAKPKAKD